MLDGDKNPEVPIAPITSTEADKKTATTVSARPDYWRDKTLAGEEAEKDNNAFLKEQFVKQFGSEPKTNSGAPQTQVTPSESVASKEPQPAVPAGANPSSK